jgi:hypothetical protein
MSWHILVWCGTQASVKFQILSGDSVIIRGPTGAPPPEKQINFSGIIAPKLARRAGDQYVPITLVKLVVKQTFAGPNRRRMRRGRGKPASFSGRSLSERKCFSPRRNLQTPTESTAQSTWEKTSTPRRTSPNRWSRRAS